MTVSISHMPTITSTCTVHACVCPQVDEWRGRASRFLSLCEDIAQLHCSVVGGANRAVLYDLYPYVWDLRNTALVAKAFICWLGKDTEKLRQEKYWDTE